MSMKRGRPLLEISTDDPDPHPSGLLLRDRRGARPRRGVAEGIRLLRYARPDLFTDLDDEHTMTETKSHGRHERDRLN